MIKAISELEAKYTNPSGQVSVQDLTAVLRGQGFRPEVIDSQQTDRYFDTADFDLAGRKLSLRLRTKPNCQELTFKRIISDPEEGVFVRQEVTEGLTPDHHADVTEGLEGLQPLILLRQYVSESLTESLEVRNHRVQLIIVQGDSVVEVAHDDVTFTSPRKTSLIRQDYEIEIELKGPDTQLLNRVIHLLRGTFPQLVAQHLDKYHRGLSMLGIGDFSLVLSAGRADLQVLSRNEVSKYLDEVPTSARGRFSTCLEIVAPRLSQLSQLSLLYHPGRISDALHLNFDIESIIGRDPFLDHERLFWPESCFISVDIPRIPFVFFTHTRLQHSIDASRLAMDLGRSAGLDEKQIVILGIAGLTHDVGHPALCHSGEVVVSEITKEDHEARTLQFVRNNQALFEGLDMELFTQTLQEEGIGQILSIADTLGYVLRDSHEAGWQIDASLETGVVSNFRYERGHILLEPDLAEALLRLLDVRYRLYLTLYFHPYSRIEEEMQQKALRWAIQHNLITCDTLLSGADPQLLLRMAEIAAQNSQAKQLAAGFFPDYCAVYHYRPIATWAPSEEGPTEKDLIELGFDPASFIISQPFTKAGKKQIRGLNLKGEPVSLQTRMSEVYHPYDTKTILAFSPRISSQEIFLRLFRPLH